MMIAIPIFSMQLEKTKEATDLANMRSAKFLAASEFMSVYDHQEYYRYFDIKSGRMTDNKPEGYGMSDVDSIFFSEGLGSGIPFENGVAKVIAVHIDTNGNVTITWES